MVAFNNQVKLIFLTQEQNQLPQSLKQLTCSVCSLSTTVRRPLRKHPSKHKTFPLISVALLHQIIKHINSLCHLEDHLNKYNQNKQTYLGVLTLCNNCLCLNRKNRNLYSLKSRSTTLLRSWQRLMHGQWVVTLSIYRLEKHRR